MFFHFTWDVSLEGKKKKHPSRCAISPFKSTKQIEKKKKINKKIFFLVIQRRADNA
jgi:hypothetical protein